MTSLQQFPCSANDGYGDWSGIEFAGYKGGLVLWLTLGNNDAHNAADPVCKEEMIINEDPIPKFCVFFILISSHTQNIHFFVSPFSSMSVVFERFYILLHPL